MNLQQQKPHTFLVKVHTMDLKHVENIEEFYFTKNDT